MSVQQPSRPLISVLIPVYNRVQEVERAIASSVNQTYEHLEIIVIDNHSTDGTWEVVQSWVASDNRIKAFRNESNLGPLRNWQRGWQLCQGEFVKIVWSDDWMDPCCIARCMERVDEVSNTCLVFTAVTIHRPQNEELAYWFPGRSVFTQEEFFHAAVVRAALPVSPGAALVRRTGPGFRTQFSGWARLHQIALQTGAGADMLFLWDAALRSERIGYVDEPLNHFHAGPDSFTMSRTDEVLAGYRWAYRYFTLSVLPTETGHAGLVSRWRGFKPHRFYYESWWRKVTRRVRLSIRTMLRRRSAA